MTAPPSFSDRLLEQLRLAAEADLARRLQEDIRRLQEDIDANNARIARINGV